MEEPTSDPYSLFIYAIKSPMTRIKYERRLSKFFDYVGILPGPIQVRCNAFVEKGKNDSNKWISNNIIKFLQMQKGRMEKKEITAGTIRNYVKSIKLFCEMADMLIPWKKITRGLPKGRRYANDRAPTIAEIKKILDYPDRRIKPIVCTMASSGIRLGAWDYLKWGNIKPIEIGNQIVAAKMMVYADEDAQDDTDEYFTFITPEAYFTLAEWMKYREESGELISSGSWLMRNLWEVTTPSGGQQKGLVTIPKRLKSTGVKRLMERAQWAQGVRKRLADGKKRHEFQVDHGFRKYFKTTCEYAKMSSINVETLMGHSIGISDSYLRATESQLLEDYLKAVDFLTIGEEYQLKKQVSEVAEKNKDENYIIRGKLQEKDEEMRTMKEQFNAMQSQLYALITALGSVKDQNQINQTAQILYKSGILNSSQQI